MKIWAWHLPKQFIICQIFTPCEMWIGLLPGNRKNEDSTYLRNIIVHSISRYVTLTCSQKIYNLRNIMISESHRALIIRIWNQKSFIYMYYRPVNISLPVSKKITHYILCKVLWKEFLCLWPKHLPNYLCIFSFVNM